MPTTDTTSLRTSDLLRKLEGLHTERNSLAGRFTQRSQGYTIRLDRPELRARLTTLTKAISDLEVEYAGRLSYVNLDTGRRGYTCPRCGLGVMANECGTAFAYVETDGCAIGCCEECMHEMLADPVKRIAAALVAWKAN